MEEKEENIAENEISVKDILNNLSDIKKLIQKHKLIALSILIVCTLLGLGASLLIKPKYTAVLTFAMQDDDKTSGLSGIASQFGFSMGGSSGGAFGGDNLYELLTTRNLIEKALLCTTDIDGKKDNLLNLYIDTYELKDKWKESKRKEIRELAFPLSQERNTFSRTQDSVLQIIFKTIVKQPMLTVAKRSKKLSIGDITFTSENEVLSKLFVENLIRETTQFYVDTKTKISRQNYNILSRQADSVKAEYNKAVAQRASMADNLLNVVRQSAGVGLIKKQTDLQVSANAYIEMKKNLEILKMSIGRETPLVQVIDSPILPLEKTRLGKAKGIVIGGFAGLLIIIISFTALHIYRKFKYQLLN